VPLARPALGVYLLRAAGWPPRCQAVQAKTEAALAPVIAKGKPVELRAIALAALGAVQENAGKFNEALQTYTQLTTLYPDNFLAAKSYESIGRINELTGMNDQAKAAYEKLSTQFPGSAWSQRAQERLAALQQPVTQTLTQKK
jgi:tetratricopeptide (TPR) repeat protein